MEFAAQNTKPTNRCSGGGLKTNSTGQKLKDQQPPPKTHERLRSTRTGANIRVENLRHHRNLLEAVVFDNPKKVAVQIQFMNAVLRRALHADY